MTDHSLTAKQLVDITGMKYVVLVDLQKRGVITPSKVRAVGTGHSSIYDTADAFAVWTIQRFRPKVQTTQLLRALYDFWHSQDGLAIVHGDAGERGIVVIDEQGRVSLELETDLKAIAKARRSPTLLVIEPTLLSKELFDGITKGSRAGGEESPLPSGSLPKRKNVEENNAKAAVRRPAERGKKAEPAAPVKRAKTRTKR